MPSVLGLLEAKESAARERVEQTREEAVRIAAVLEEAEGVLERLVIAREAVVEVLAEPAAQAVAPVEEAVEPVSVAAVGAVPRSTVPHRRGGLTSTVLAPDYQRIMSVVEAEAAGRERIRAGALAVALGLEAVPAKIEGVRSKAGRLAERGWLARHRPGVFSIPTS